MNALVPETGLGEPWKNHRERQAEREDATARDGVPRDPEQPVKALRSSPLFHEEHSKIF